MTTAATQIRIDAQVKKEATILFQSLGLDMSSAVNLFLRQCILRRGIPFAIEVPDYNQETLEAMAEARRISKNPSVKSYDSMDELKAALEE